MFRFSIRSLLILIAVVALWLSTIAFYEGANDVRAFVMLSVLVASGVAVTKYDGRRRAFWVGFFLTVLTTGFIGKSPFGLPWPAERLLNEYRIFQNLPNGHLNPTYFFAISTIHAAMVLLIATVMGLLGVLVYGAVDKPSNRLSRDA
jgi:hypothetical protein